MFVCPACASIFPAQGFCTEDGSALADSAQDPLLGQTVGSYRLARQIGSGGMGAVYLGVQPVIGSRVAVKVLSPAASSEPTLVERFFAEARSVNLIRHESIVSVLDFGHLPDGRPCITMEYLEGAALSRIFEQTRPLPLARLARIGLEVLGALAAAHALGITHRDLKPDNIFVTSLGRVKVLDFGIAKLRPEHGGAHDGTRTGALLGTPHYMSPEQALGQAVDPRSDLYSLGVILFEGATGQRPFHADSLFELLRFQIEAPPSRPRSLRPDLPPSFEELILCLLEKERERRFQTADACAQALSVLLRELPASPEPEPSLPPPTPAPALAPTVGATAVTLAAAQMSDRSGSSLGLWIGIGGVLVAILALAVVGVAMLFGTSLLRQSGVAGGAGSAEPASTGAPGAQAKPGKRIDPIAKLSEARTEARKQFADAELVGMSMSGIELDGTVDISAANHAIAYMFRSPSAADETCLVSVSISMWGTFASKVKDASYDCKQATISAPSCSLKGVLQELKPGDELHSATYQSSGSSFQWVIIFASGGGMRIKPDNC
jgi:serine/threonine protein kinase